MPDIIIPKKLNDRLSLDSTWQSIVTSLKESVQKITRESPYFFPDYTDHGIDHINEVLTLADRLISEDTYTAKETDTEHLLAPRSVGFLVCAILVHDLGMFLKTDGIEQLVYGGHSTHLMKDLDETDWKDIWTKYMENYRRMKDNEKEHLFGRIIHISADPARQGSSITEDERRVIGEFLRQNHGRLAHEIAVHGFPGDKEVMLITGNGISDEDRDMIGLLARSHCMNIRDTEEYIECFGEGSKPYGIPAFYLMTVLRMADYLDASEKRAPEILERIQKIRVPASSKEWSWNKCISRGPKQWELQKHNLVIHANPTKSTEYVLLDNWLRSIQAELDLCWSIIADQYSGESYRLTIHRVLSNIRQKKSREKFNLKFLTREAKITANPAIVKLMMEPLYGDDPTYGVRELLQNAVDACLERERWENTNEKGDPNYKGLVDIRIENGTFTITDNGMGMNEDVLLNYYLSAGSSYRSSDAWTAANAPDGKSQVARTGKFGVGFLAAFLLGDEVEVLTQYREDKKGYQFKFDQESRPLDIKRTDRINPYTAEVSDTTHTGTTITIKLKDVALQHLDSRFMNYLWHNWYAFDEPRVRYFIDGTELFHQNLQLHRDPKKNNGWLTLSAEDFDSYQWNPNYESRSEEFYCNGIRIYTNAINLRKDELNLPFPHVSVIDKNGHLDVKLSRNSLRTFPMKQELYRELYRWHIARLLLTPWVNETHYQKNCFSGFTLSRDRYLGHIPFLLSKRGFSLNHASVIPLLDLKDYVILCFNGTNTCSKIHNAIDVLLQDTPFSIIAESPSAEERRIPPFDLNNPVAFFDRLLANRIQLFTNSAIQYSLYNCCDSLWLNKTFEYLIPYIPADRLTEYPEMYAIHLTDPPSEMLIDRSGFHSSDFIAALHLVNKFEFHGLDCSQFTQTLREVLVPEPDYPDQDIWIPFDMEERQKKFRTLFENLSDYMNHIRNHPME